MMMPNANAMETDSNDDEPCTICNKKGLVTECDGCGKWNHWHCVDKYHQPTSGKYFCMDCRNEKNEHPVSWDMLPASIEWHDCIICMDKKPDTEFINEFLPACPCKSKVCAHCAYTMAEKAGPDNAGSKCPTCRVQWTAFVPRTECGIAADPIPLDHKQGNEDTQDEQDDDAFEAQLAAAMAASAPAPAVAAPAPAPAAALATAPTGGFLTAAEVDEAYDDIFAIMNEPTGNTALEDADEARAEARDPSYSPNATQLEEMDIADDDDSIVDDTPSSRSAGKRKKARGKKGKGDSPKKTIFKEHTGLVRKAEIRFCNSPTEVNPSFKQKTEGKVSSRVNGSSSKKEPYTEDRRREVVLLCQERESRVPRTNAKSKIDYSKLHDEQYDMMFHLKILMIKAGDAMGGGGKKADKYPRYLLQITGEDGLASKVHFQRSALNDASAWTICMDAAEKVSESNEASAKRLAQNYWNAYVTYCQYLEDEDLGKLKAEP